MIIVYLILIGFTICKLVNTKKMYKTSYKINFQTNRRKTALRSKLRGSV